MKKPYFEITAVCENERCQETVFVVDRKQIFRTGTSGQPYKIEHVVCPGCRQWQPINEIREIA